MTTGSSRQTERWLKLRELFSSYLANDVSATRELFSELQKTLSAFFRARTRSNEDADELAQAALLKIHLGRDQFDLSRSLKTWVFTIANRSLIDHWRGLKTEPLDKTFQPDFEENLNAELASIADPSIRPDQRFEWNHDLRGALETLKPLDRSIVYLYAVEGFSMSEIAQTMGMTENAAKVRAHRSYHKLKEALTLG